MGFEVFVIILLLLVLAYISGVLWDMHTLLLDLHEHVQNIEQAFQWDDSLGKPESTWFEEDGQE